MEFNFQVVYMRNCIAVLVVCDVTLLYCKLQRYPGGDLSACTHRCSGGSGQQSHP